MSLKKRHVYAIFVAKNERCYQLCITQVGVSRPLCLCSLAEAVFRFVQGRAHQLVWYIVVSRLVRGGAIPKK